MKRIIQKTLLGIVLLTTTNLSAGQIIANINCPLTKMVLSGQEVSVVKLKKIFEGKIDKCIDGNKISKFALNENEPLMGAFAKNIFNIEAVELFHMWSSLEISQGIAKPTIVSTTNRMLRSISNTNNSVGIVSDDTILPPNIIQIYKF